MSTVMATTDSSTAISCRRRLTATATEDGCSKSASTVGGTDGSTANSKQRFTVTTIIEGKVKTL